ncbi:MAG TPA: AI-2E family transporter, partial [Gemmataceae bacterium]
FSFVLSPIVVRLQHRGLGRTGAVGATILLTLIVIAAIGTVVSHQVAELADALPDRREAIKQKITAAKHAIVGDGQSRFGQIINDITGVVNPEPAGEAVIVKSEPPSIVSLAEKYLGPAAELMGQAALTFILVIFMLLRREDLRNRAIRLLGNGAVMTTTRAVDDASHRISRFLLTQVLINCSFGVLIAFGLFLLGVSYPLLWGFVSALMRYVPYFGTWIGLIPPFLFSLTGTSSWGGAWGQPLGVLGLYAGLELFCINLLEPRLFGRSMGISEVAQVIATACWGFLWGPIGLILASPMTVCLLVLGRHVNRFRYLVVLLGDEPPLTPRLAFYQRLVARDQDEAAELAIAGVQKHGLEATLDELLIPALCSARGDAETGQMDRHEVSFIASAVQEIAEEVKGDQPEDHGDDRVRILLCSARDKIDTVAVQLLALSLDPHRWEVKIAGDETLASELLELVEEYRPALVVVGCPPPGGLSHARYLVVRLHRDCPDASVVIGRWGCTDESQMDRQKAVRTGAAIDRTLADTRKRLDALHATLPVESAQQTSG